MIPTFYFIGFGLFALGLIFYIVSSVQLSKDIASGAIPVRGE